MTSDGHISGLLHNMSVPPRTKVDFEVRPVFGAVNVSLAQCLRLHGLLDPELRIRETHFDQLGQATLKWFRDPARLWRDLADKGCTRESADACARDFGGTCIGWHELVYPQPDTVIHYPAHNRICTDVNLCVAILSRRVHNLFLSHRPPDYSLEQLFCWALVLDDPRLVARSISWEEWPINPEIAAHLPGPYDDPLKNAPRRTSPPRTIPPIL